MLQNLGGGHFRGQSVEFLERFRLPVFDERIRPTDSLDRSADAGVVEIFNHRHAKSVEEQVVLERSASRSQRRDRLKISIFL